MVQSMFSPTNDWLVPTSVESRDWYMQTDAGTATITANSWSHRGNTITLQNAWVRSVEKQLVIDARAHTRLVWATDTTGIWGGAGAHGAGGAGGLGGWLTGGTGSTGTTIRIDTTTNTGKVIFGDVDTFAPIGRLKRPLRLPARTNHRGQTLRAEHKERLFDGASPEELVALRLLRTMVEPDAFKKYLKHGFVNVRGPSGLTYQIPRQGNIVVWDRGERIASLCIHLKDWRNKPPSDEVVAKMLIAELDEPDLYKRSNVSWYTQNRDRPALYKLGLGVQSKLSAQVNQQVIQRLFA